VPAKLDFEHLVPLATVNLDGISAYRLGDAHALRRRQGFALTDAGTDLTGALDQANYCIWCTRAGQGFLFARAQGKSALRWRCCCVQEKYFRREVGRLSA